MKQVKIEGKNYKLVPIKGKTKAKTDAVDNCKAWVTNKRKTEFKSIKDTSYVNKDGKTIKAKELSFANGEKYNVGSYRFWKV